MEPHHTANQTTRGFDSVYSGDDDRSASCVLPQAGSRLTKFTAALYQPDKNASNFGKIADFPKKGYFSKKSFFLIGFSKTVATSRFCL